MFTKEELQILLDSIQSWQNDPITNGLVIAMTQAMLFGKIDKDHNDIELAKAEKEIRIRQSSELVEKLNQMKVLAETEQVLKS